MADTSQLNQAVQDLTAQVQSTEGTEASATALINGFAQQVQTAVTDALNADNAADQGSIDAAVSAIQQVRDRFNASAAQLGAAVANQSGGGTGGGGTDTGGGTTGDLGNLSRRR